MARPYGLTDEELFAFGGDVEAIIEHRFAEATRAAGEWSIPNPANFDWNPRVKSWGVVWAEYHQTEMAHQRHGFRRWMVTAGLGGSLQGVPVAHDLSQDAARLFTRDFEAGKIMCGSVLCAELWESLVDAAWSVSKVGIDREYLKSFAREYGLVGRFKMDRSNLIETYNNGETIDDVLKALGVSY